MMKHNVSVIIPIYNTGDYLTDCLNSIVTQKLVSLEIILVNDGSTDNSEKICKKYVELYNNITYIYQDNGGAAKARNVGVHKATGEYIYFMDSDDMLEPNTLHKTYSKAVENNLDIVIFNAKTIIEASLNLNEVETISKANNYQRNKEYKDIYTGEKILELLINNNDYYVPVWMYMTKSSHLSKHSEYFMEGNLHDDELFTPVNLINASRVGFINEKLFIRRYRPNSVMTIKNHTHLKYSMNSYFLVIKSLIEKNKLLKSNMIEELILIKYLSYIRNTKFYKIENHHKNIVILKKKILQSKSKLCFKRKIDYIAIISPKIYKLMAIIKLKTKNRRKLNA